MDVATVVIAAAAVGVALVALYSDLWFRRSDGLASLLARFEAGEFYTRMWRVEQRSRPPDGEPWSIEPFDVVSSAADEPVVRQALARRYEATEKHLVELLNKQ